MTTAPSFTMSPRTISALPAAATRMSARLATAPRSFVRVWQIVTVACRFRSISARGLPTMLLRPTMTASFPSMAIPLRSSNSMTPSGVQAR